MSTEVVYEIDNDKLVGKLIEDNWSLKTLKPTFYYLEDTNAFAHNFGQNTVGIKVYVDDLVSRPLGIAYDGESLSRKIRFIVMGIKRETVIAASNELRRILAVHRYLPFGYWQVIEYVSETSRVVRTYNAWEKGYTYRVALPYHAIPKKLIQ